MISVVFTLRNDDHGQHMLQRANLFLACLAHIAERCKLRIEPVLVEWNPPPDERVWQALDWPETTRRFRPKVVIVSPDIHDLLPNSNHPKLQLFQMIAKNVGIRASTGEFILCTNPDVLISPELGWQLATTLSPDRVYRAIRADLNRTYADIGQFLLGDWYRLYEWCRTFTIQVHDGKCWGLHTHACGDFMMMHRRRWHQMRGYPEMPIWSIHLDSYGLAQATKALGLKEEVLSGGLFHLDHKASWQTDPGYGDGLPQLTFKETCLLTKDMRPGFVFNSENWGLQDYELEEMRL